MPLLRAFLIRHRWLAAGLVMAALLMKAFIPTGYMPGASGSAMLVQLCSGQGVQTILIETPGKSGGHEDGDKTTAETPCAFASLSGPSLAAVDPILLAIAITFILTALFRNEAQIALRRDNYLRPPSQAPPATA